MQRPRASGGGLLCTEARDGMRMPLVSIGMQVINGERFLRQAIESILAQDFPNLELIVSDNASTDATPETTRPNWSWLLPDGRGSRGDRPLQSRRHTSRRSGCPCPRDNDPLEIQQAVETLDDALDRGGMRLPTSGHPGPRFLSAPPPTLPPYPVRRRSAGRRPPSPLARPRGPRAECAEPSKGLTMWRRRDQQRGSARAGRLCGRTQMSFSQCRLSSIPLGTAFLAIAASLALDGRREQLWIEHTLRPLGAPWPRSRPRLRTTARIKRQLHGLAPWRN